jgi:hypothetical protein
VKCASSHASGADLSRIELVSMVQDKGKDRMFSLVTDLPLLRQKIIEVGDVRMVQIEPISAYLGVGKVDSFRTTDVRAVLAPLVDLAAEMRVAVIGILHFNKKLDVTNSLLRISDSLAFGVTAGHAFAAVDDAENKRKLFVRGKNNLARSDIQALASKEVAPDICARTSCGIRSSSMSRPAKRCRPPPVPKAPPPATTPKSSSRSSSLVARSSRPRSWRQRRRI